MLAHDVDRGVATVGMRSWADFITTTHSLARDNQDEHCTSSEAPRALSQSKITFNPRLFISLLKFVHRTVLDPQGLHTALNPVPVIPSDVSSQQGHKGAPQGKGATQGKVVPQGKGGTQGKKGSPIPQSQQKKSGRYVPPSSDSSSPTPSSLSDRVASDSVGEENDSDRAGRLRVGALGVVGWVLGTSGLSLFGSRWCLFVISSFVIYACCSVIDTAYLENWPEVDSASATDLLILTTQLSSLAFWSTLHPAAVSSRSSLVNQQLCPFSVTSFGQGQPQVRRAAWTLVGSLIKVFKGLFCLLVCVFVESLYFAFPSSRVIDALWHQTDYQHPLFGS